MANVLTNPDRFFAELSAKDTNLKIPFAIVLVVAIIDAIDKVVMVSAITPTLPSDVAQFAGIFAVVIAIKALVYSFIDWFIYAGIFYVISTLFKGEGSFKRVLEFTGYGFIPTIITSVVASAATMTVLPIIGTWFENPELMKQTLMQNPVMHVSAIISILLMLWSAYIWIFGIKHARYISTKHALITVGVPVGLYLIFVIITRFFIFPTM